MPYCARCGVEVDQGVGACPLCDATIPVFDEPAGGEAETAPERRYPPASGAPSPPTPQQLRLSIWATLSAIFLISLLVVLTANLVETGWRITWSGYALGAIGLAWVLSTIILVIYRPPWLVVLCMFPPVTSFLALVDRLDGAFDWFLTAGLTVCSSAFLSAEVSTILWTVWKDRGANQLAILLAMIGLSSLGIDLVTASAAGRDGLTWSFVVLGVLIPLSGFLFVYHYVLRKVLKLERFFHV